LSNKLAILTQERWQVAGVKACGNKQDTSLGRGENNLY